MNTKLQYGFYGVLLALCLMNSCNSCNEGTQEARTARAIARLDSTLALRPTEGAVDTIIRAEGLRVSKRMLYDNNAVVRTAVRPDDVIRGYDDQLDSLAR